MDLKTYLSLPGNTQSKLAEKLGCTQGLVSHWMNGMTIKAEWCVKIEAATGGKVTRAEIRPDLFGKAA